MHTFGDMMMMIGHYNCVAWLAECYMMVVLVLLLCTVEYPMTATDSVVYHHGDESVND